MERTSTSKSGSDSKGNRTREGNYQAIHCNFIKEIHRNLEGEKTNLGMEYWINKSETLIGSAFIVSILKFYLVLPV